MLSEKNNRWSLWARSIAGRHLRFTQRRESLALVLLRLRSQLHIVRERWSFTTRLIQPRLHLAINAVLTPTRKGLKAEGPFLCTLAPLREKTYSTTSRLLSEPHKEVRSERTTREINRSRTLLNERSRLQTQLETSKSPLTFVFERINQSKTAEVLVRQQVRSIVERVTLQSRRNETMLIANNTLIARQMSSAQTLAPQPRVMKTVSEHTRVLEKTTQAAPVTTVVETAPWLQDKVSVAGLNIDQITDQVVKQLDHRVVAARERRGRI